ncbi:MAG: hypothetical protein AAF385_13095, partial [Pseudomonadota bacterium]
AHLLLLLFGSSAESIPEVLFLIVYLSLLLLFLFLLLFVFWLPEILMFRWNPISAPPFRLGIFLKASLVPRIKTLSVS